MRATRSKEKDYGVSAASVDCMRSILQIVYDHGVVAMYRMEKGKKVRTQREFEKWFMVDSRECGLPDDIVPYVGTLYEGVVTMRQAYAEERYEDWWTMMERNHKVAKEQIAPMVGIPSSQYCGSMFPVLTAPYDIERGYPPFRLKGVRG